jgi:type II secretory pathway pseudopilin PulG
MMKTGLVVAKEVKGAVTRNTPLAVHVQRKAERAGTLVEVVVATVIIAIAGAGIVGSINYGMFVTQLARENARATQIMLEKLESIRLYDWTEVTNAGFVPSTFVDVYDPQSPTNYQGAIYNGTMTVSNAAFSGTAPSYANNMRQFTVTLTWTTNDRIPHYRSLSTYVSKDGLQNYVY